MVDHKAYQDSMTWCSVVSLCCGRAHEV